MLASGITHGIINVAGRFSVGLRCESKDSWQCFGLVDKLCGGLRVQQGNAIHVVLGVGCAGRVKHY